MLDGLLEKWTAIDPAFPALEFSRGAADSPPELWTYGNLAAQVETTEKQLGAVVPASVPVAIVMAPHGDAVAALLAALRRRNPAVMLPTTLPAGELSSILSLSGAAALFSPSIGDHPEWQRLGRPSGNPRSAGVPGSEIAVCQLTSGSTGASRLAMRDRAALRAEIAAVSAALQLESLDRISCLSSIAHSYGLMGGLLAPLAVGARVWLGGRPDDLASFVGSRPPTVVFGLAATYAALVSADAANLSAGRALLSAGAPLPPGLQERFRAQFGLPIRQDYGTTETGTIALDMRGDAAPQTVGFALPHMEVRIQGPGGVELPSGQEGEIQVRSVAVARGYFTDAGREACADREGWFHTRDVGAFDSAGRLIVGRRLRDRIRLPSGSIDPDTIETALTQLGGVDECVVVSTRSSEGRVSVKVIVASSSLVEGDVCRFLSTQLPEVARIAAIQIVDELPRSPAGKIVQKYLL